MRRHRDVGEQIVVVHGATSSVGRATVLEALDRRARVAAVDSDARGLAALDAEAGVPHRLESVVVDAHAGEAETVARITYATTARFGLLHTWVHVTGRERDDVLSVGGASSAVVRQLRRSGGGAFVVVAPEPEPVRVLGRSEPSALDADVRMLQAETDGVHDLVSVTLVRREGIVPPDRVARAVLRAAVRPRAVARVRGSARRDALLAHVTPTPAHARHRPQGAWLLR